MKRTPLIAMAILATFGVATAAAAPLTVTVNGVKAGGGTLYVGVQTEAQFMKDDGIAGDMIETPAAGTHTVTLDVPEGQYGVSVWHDTDADGVFSRDETGMPADGWAMVGGADLRGMPTFATNSVTVGPDGASVTESLIYP